MSSYAFSHHALDRLQQRGLPPIVIELLARFGASERSHRAEKIFFDKQARKELRRYLGGARSMRVIEPWLNAYAVLGDDGTVVTAGFREKRIARA